MSKPTSFFKELQERFNEQEDVIKRLQEEIQKLRNGIWEKEEVAKLKAERDKAIDDLNRGFGISEEEAKRIKEWQTTYLKKYSPLPTTIGGGFSYHFTPTSIGTIANCIGYNGESINFRNIY